MDLRITFKTPDTVSRAIDEAIDEERCTRRDDGGDLDDETEAELREHLEASAAKWVRYGEYVTITVDTLNDDACVDPALG